MCPISPYTQKDHFLRCLQQKINFYVSNLCNMFFWQKTLVSKHEWEWLSLHNSDIYICAQILYNVFSCNSLFVYQKTNSLASLGNENTPYHHHGHGIKWCNNKVKKQKIFSSTKRNILNEMLMEYNIPNQDWDKPVLLVIYGSKS